MIASELKPGDLFRTRNNPGTYFKLKGHSTELGWLDAIRYTEKGVKIRVVQLPGHTIVLPKD